MVLASTLDLPGSSWRFCSQREQESRRPRGGAAVKEKAPITINRSDSNQACEDGVTLKRKARLPSKANPMAPRTKHLSTPFFRELSFRLSFGGNKPC